MTIQVLITAPMAWFATMLSLAMLFVLVVAAKLRTVKHVNTNFHNSYKFILGLGLVGVMIALAGFTIVLMAGFDVTITLVFALVAILWVLLATYFANLSLNELRYYKAQREAAEMLQTVRAMTQS